MSKRESIPGALLALLLAVAAAPAGAIDCATVAGNLMPNCGFESGTTGWASTTGIQLSGAGETGSGGYFTDDQAGFATVTSPCAAAAAGTPLVVGMVITAHGPASSGLCQLSALQFTDPACTTLLSSASIGAPELFSFGAFTAFDGSHEVEVGAASVALALACDDEGNGFEAVVDNGYVAVGPVAVQEVPFSATGLAALAAALALVALLVLRSRG